MPTAALPIPANPHARPVPPGPTPAIAGEPCVICGTVTQKLHCKEICSCCGARRDCSDL